MKKLKLKKQLASDDDDDRLTISKCNTCTPSSSSSSLPDSIPPDVFTEIISRLPAKSIPNCRRVSKSWAATLRSSDFDELFLTKSPNQPLILFAFMIESRLPFFTSPQDHEDSSLEATLHRTYLQIDRFSKITPPARGLLCIEDKRRMLVICNPITGESVILPKPESNLMWSRSVLGYEPVEKQFKVFCTTWSPHHPLNTTHGEHYVLTLGSKTNWRMVESWKPFRPVFDGGICINGVLYYVGKLNCYPEDVVIVCFDVRFEKLSFINKPKGMRQIQFDSRLVNHKGRLGVIQCSNSRKITGSTTKSFDLWILEDAKKHGWTKRIYVLPIPWRDMVGNTKLRVLGMTGTCEILLSPYELCDPYYLVYYNIEMNIVRKVEIRGFGSFKTRTIPHLFVDYVEDVKFI
ncbi:PREDICTED: F-box protein DOR-like [Camelina sativa]|uniref:F-box protein DOR-like n=1 Tax=Camelina sativa TaxID=90675 RepID=A0ABM0T192_CAMSA|nr:PREDICTED: F-box protein DOR-like [Camelina sativa]